MRNEIKTKCFYSNAMKVLLTFCVSVMCLFCMNALYQSMAVTSVNTTFDQLQADGTTKYFTLSCTDSTTTSTKYLKVVKPAATQPTDTSGALTVYEADSLAGAASAASAGTVSENLTGSWSFDNPDETWTITAGGTNYTAIADLNEITASVEYTYLNATDTTKYFNVLCVSSTGTVSTKYLKVVKPAATLPTDTNGALTVYEANSLAGATSAGTVSENLTGSWSVVNSGETWTITADGTNYTAIADLNDCTSLAQSVRKQYSSEQVLGTTKYFSVSCVSSTGTVSTKYLKVVKQAATQPTDTSGALTVYEADSLADAIDINPEGTPAPAVSINLTGTWSYDIGKETWTITADGINYIAVANLMDLECQSWGNLPTGGALPEGATCYYKVQCKQITEVEGSETITYVDKYLKVVKDTNETLTVYSADTLGAAKALNPASAPDENFMGRYVITGTAAAPYIETWYLALSPNNDGITPQFINAYSNIVSLNPLTTTIQSNKVWDSKSYVEVAVGTTVKFALTGVSPEVVFYVKKVEVGNPATKKLQLSSDNVTYVDYLVYNGHTINVYLKPAVTSTTTPEEWIITITGYEMDDAYGKAITYKVEEKEIVASTQLWMSQGTNVVHTFNGVESETHDVVYTLQLNGISQTAHPMYGPFDLVRITKKVQNGKVTQIEVEGLKGQIDSSAPVDSVTFATVVNASATVVGVVAPVVMPAVDGKVTFSSMPDPRVENTLYIDDMIDNVVTVNIHIGEDNPLFTLNLTIDEDGKLSYRFRQLPLRTYQIDTAVEGAVDEIVVAESSPYRVLVTKTSTP